MKLVPVSQISDELADQIAEYIAPLVKKIQERKTATSPATNDGPFYQAINHFLGVYKDLTGLEIENTHEFRSAVGRALARRKARKNSNELP